MRFKFLYLFFILVACNFRDEENGEQIIDLEESLPVITQAEIVGDWVEVAYSYSIHKNERLIPNEGFSMNIMHDSIFFYQMDSLTDRSIYTLTSNKLNVIFDSGDSSQFEVWMSGDTLVRRLWLSTGKNSKSSYFLPRNETEHNY